MVCDGGRECNNDLLVDLVLPGGDEGCLVCFDRVLLGSRVGPELDLAGGGSRA